MQRSRDFIARALGHEGDVDPALPDQCQTRGRGAFDEFHRHAVKVPPELLERIGEQDEGQADADCEFAMLSALQRIDALHGALQVIEAEGGLFEEPRAGRGWADAGVIALEEFGSEAMLEGAYAPADSRMLDVECGGGASKTPMLGRGKDIPKKTKIDNAAGHVASLVGVLGILASPAPLGETQQVIFSPALERLTGTKLDDPDTATADG